MSKDPRLERVGVSGYNKPKRTPNHPTKSHVVVAKCSDGSVKTIRFGQQNAKTAGAPKKGESEAMKKQGVSLLRQDTPRTLRGVIALRLTGRIR